MARINIEDTIWKDPGFQKLLIKIGDRHRAMGVMIDLWSLAQQYWFPDKRLIPRSEFIKADLPEFLFDPAICLAEERDGGVYAKGSEESFEWLFIKQAAGKASGDARKRKKQKKLQIVEQPLTDVDSSQRQSTDANIIQRMPTSSSFSSSISNSLSSSFSGERAEKISPPPETNSVVKIYCDLWRERYKAPKSPPIGGKVAGQFKSLVRDFGVRRAEELIRAYLAMPDSWFMTKRHDITTLLTNLNAVAQFADSGRMISKTEIRQADESAALSAQLKRIEAGEL